MFNPIKRFNKWKRFRFLSKLKPLIKNTMFHVKQGDVIWSREDIYGEDHWLKWNVHIDSMVGAVSFKRNDSILTIGNVPGTNAERLRSNRIITGCGDVLSLYVEKG